MKVVQQVIMAIIIASEPPVVIIISLWVIIWRLTRLLIIALLWFSRLIDSSSNWPGSLNMLWWIIGAILIYLLLGRFNSRSTDSKLGGNHA